MKKLLFLSVLVLFTITGCGVGATKTMSCSYKTNSNNITTKTSYDVDYEGNDIKKVRITYKYHQNVVNDTNGDGKNDIDGVGTGTDGTTNDTLVGDDDGIIDGVVGSAIDRIVGGVTDVVLDIAGIRDRHANVLNTYGDVPGFAVQNTTDDTDKDYTVTYVIDYDTISDANLTSLNLPKDINTFRDNYTSQGFTCND